jgi:hypothetical protein
LATIKRLNPVFYFYNDDRHRKILPGLVAEEVPLEMHVTHGKGADLMLNYVQMTTWAMGAIKELSAKIEEIEKRLSHEYPAQTT